MHPRYTYWLGGLAASAIAFGAVACGGSDPSQLSGVPQHGAGSGVGGSSGGHGASSGGGGGGGGGLECLNSETTCNDACVDTTTDLANCGGCGMICGGTCALGHCTVTLVPSSGAQVGGGGAIAVSATDVYYFGAGGLMSVPIAGGTPTVVDAQGTGAIAVDATSVYYFGAQGVMSVPFAGGQTAVLAKSATGNALAVGATGFCWASMDEGAVTCMPLAPAPDGGKVEKLTSPQNSPGGVAGNATTVFWTNAGSVAAGGGLAPLTGTIGHMALDASGTATDGGLHDAGGETPLVSGQNDPSAIALDSTNVYWTDTGTTANSFTDGAIMMVPAAGGTATALAQAQNNPVGIAADGTNVYWTSAGTLQNHYDDGALLRIAPGGGTPTVLASGLTNPRGVAVDAANVYWTTATGAVLKMAK